MQRTWLSVVRWLFGAPAGATRRVVHDIARFGIGFCPGCKRLRGAPSPRCDYCGSTQPVVPDA